MELPYRFLIWVAKLCIRIMGWKLRVEGVERIPTSGPALLVSNHVSFMDPIQLGLAAFQRRRFVRYLAKRELWDQRLIGFFASRNAQIPVDRTGASGNAVERAIEALRAGEVVGVYPEGTISTTFALRKGRLGAARMALATGVPLIPCGVWGGQRIATRDRKFNIRRGIAMSLYLGEPISYSLDEDPAALTERIMSAISELVARAMREYPQAPAGDHDRWWLPHSGRDAATDAE